MFEKMDKPAKLLFFDKSSSEEKPSTNIKNKVQFAYVMMMMMMSTYPKGAVLPSLQYMATRGGKWAGWVINGLGNKWVGCIIFHLSIYDPFIYKLIIHYQPNPFN